MRKLFLLILISISGVCLKAQSNLDSLWNIWNDQTQHDTTRLKVMHKIAWDGYLYSQPDSAFYYAQMQYALAKKIGQKKYMAESLRTQGVSFAVRGDYSKALTHFRNSLKTYEEIDFKRGIAACLGNIGTIYLQQGAFSAALDYFQMSLTIMEEMGDKNGIATALNNTGNIYQEQGNHSKALDYYQRCLKIKEEIGDKRGVAASLVNIGIFYMNQGDYSKALTYMQKSIKSKEEIGDKRGVALSLLNIGGIYYNQDNYPQALNYYQRSLEIREGISDKKGIALSRISIGNLYQKQGDHQKAINECSKSLQLAQEIGALSLQRTACKCLYDGFKTTGNDNKALEYHEQMLVLDDSLRAEETSKKLQQMEFAKQMLADSLKQEEEKLRIQMANDEIVRKESRNRNIAIGVGLVLLLLAGGFFSRWRYVKKSRDTISKERDRSENLLLNILPADIAEELKEKGKVNARDFDTVSILFTDFKDFTRASAKLSAHDLVAEINACFEAFDAITEKYNVEKIKTIGDAYMAAGGLPVPTDNSVKNTVLAALEMQAFIATRQSDMDLAGRPAFEMRAGIHTGPVIAGIVGVKKFQYDIWGDTVNTASRMESLGSVGQVNISQSTYDLLKDDPDFAFESRGKIEAKGKGEIEMYFVSLNFDER